MSIQRYPTEDDGTNRTPITDLPVGPNKSAALKDAGFTTAEDVVAAGKDALADVLGIGTGLAARLYVDAEKKAQTTTRHRDPSTGRFVSTDSDSGVPEEVVVSGDSL